MRIFIFLILISWCNFHAQITSISELENPILSQTLKLQPGLNIPKSKTTLYYKKDMTVTGKENAYFTLTKEFHSHNYVMKGVGTYDDGYVVQADQQSAKNYLLKAYYPNGIEAFNIMMFYTPSVPDAYMLDGEAVWFREDGTLLAKGFFKSGRLNGEYIEYNPYGDEVRKAIFNQGKILDTGQFEKHTDNHIIVGDWSQVFNTDNPLEIVEELHNKYLADGTVHIYKCYYSLSEGEVIPDTEFCDDPLIKFYKYKPSGEGRGIVEFFENGELVEKESIKFINKKEYTSKTVYLKDNPAGIGTTFNFKKKSKFW